MANIWSCAPAWFDKLKDEQRKVVVALWDEEGSGKINEWLEKLAAIEDEGTPVFVIDRDSCPALSEKLAVKEVGETIVFERGVEKGRLTPGEDLEGGLERVRELTR